MRETFWEKNHSEAQIWILDFCAPRAAASLLSVDYGRFFKNVFPAYSFSRHVFLLPKKPSRHNYLPGSNDLDSFLCEIGFCRYTM